MRYALQPLHALHNHQQIMTQNNILINTIWHLVGLCLSKNQMRLGLNGNDIQTVGRSFTDPLVPTGPGVREPQNRRAVIDLGTGAIASAE